MRITNASAALKQPVSQNDVLKRTTILLFACLCFGIVLPSQAATYFYHNDHLGTPQVLTDATWQVVWQSKQDPFGEMTEVTNQVEQNLRFPGQYFDVETKNHYNYFRDYDPSIGRYVESDPLGINDGPSTYGYTHQSPVLNTDFYGLFKDPQTNQMFMALKDFGLTYLEMREKNTDGTLDKYFHCMANCKATRRGPGGEAAAECISDMRELTDMMRGTSTQDQSAADQHANRFGREAGRDLSTGSCSNACSALLPK